MQGSLNLRRKAGSTRLASSAWLAGCLILFATSHSVSAQDDCCQDCCCQSESSESCLLFWDDLFGECPSPARDPYEEPIETDRHDFTQSARTVGRGVAQIEAGYTYYYKDGTEEIEGSHTGPEMLLRYGLSEDIELRLRWTYAWIFKTAKDEHEEVNDLDGAQDLNFGFKLQLTEQECCRPESALRLICTVPTGGSDFTTNGVEIGADVVYAWELANGWELAGSSGAFRNGAGEFSLIALSGMGESGFTSDFVAWAQSVALGIPLSEQMELYLEYFGIVSDGLPQEFTLGFVNAGVDFLITNDLVFDVRLGRGLTTDSDDFFVGTGGGIRF